jgi:hypothetical protein
MIGKRAGAVALIALLAGCAAPTKLEPTGYTQAQGPRGAGYGYRDMDLGGDEFSIVVAGNRETSKERVADIALLRAASIAQERGRTHFIILKREARAHEVFRPQIIPVFVGGVMAPIPVGERSTAEPMTLLLIRLLPRQQSYPRDAIEAADATRRLADRLQ